MCPKPITKDEHLNTKDTKKPFGGRAPPGTAYDQVLSTPQI